MAAPARDVHIFQRERALAEMQAEAIGREVRAILAPVLTRYEDLLREVVELRAQVDALRGE